MIDILPFDLDTSTFLDLNLTLFVFFLCLAVVIGSAAFLLLLVDSAGDFFTVSTATGAAAAATPGVLENGLTVGLAPGITGLPGGDSIMGCCISDAAGGTGDA